MRTAILFLIPLALTAQTLCVETPPDLSSLPKEQTPIGHESTERSDYNLGATGMRGWIYGDSTDDDCSREILVRVVEKGSPADGVFRKFDLITGVDGKPFEADARETLAAALEAAEAAGKLSLVRWRDGVEENVTLKIEVLGTYSDTAPFDCAKSRKIVDNSCRYITSTFMPEAIHYDCDVPRNLNALLLLATGETAYLPQLRRYARSITAEMAKIKDFEQAAQTWTWYYGYKGLFLTEYYLRTGDRTVLPAVDKICRILARGQGLPGSWSHSMAGQEHLFPGYGAVNSTGMVCLIAMGLADKCGKGVNQQALADAFAFFGGFTGKGTPPYGDHPPGGGNVANGKSGGVAVAMTVMDAPKSAMWFSRLAASGNGRDLYSGHTGNFWNHLWTPIGASLAGRESFINFFKQVKANYTLMRRWDHGAVTNPDYSKRECYCARRKYGGPFWGPGAFTLFLTAPDKRLQIFGAPQSVFARGACPASMREAMDLYRALQYQRCLDTLARLSLSGDDARKKAQLEQAARAALEANKVGLAEAAGSIKRQDYYVAWVQLRALDGRVPPYTPAYAKLKAKLADKDIKALIDIGARYYALSNEFAEDHIRFTDEYRLDPLVTISENHRRAVEAVAKNPKAGIYQDLARRHLQDNPLHPYQRLMHEWLPTSEYSPLTPVFFSGLAVEKDVPNTDIHTLKFAPNPGKRLPVLNKKVQVEYQLPEPGATVKGIRPRGKWLAGSLPLDPVSRPGSMLRPSPIMRARISFEVDDPGKYSEWFITCMAKGTADIRLNGVRIVEVSGIDRRARIIHLKPASAALFKAGTNVLEVQVKAASGAASLDIGLDALAK